jgi:hypothetical protein
MTGVMTDVMTDEMTEEMTEAETETETEATMHVPEVGAGGEAAGMETAAAAQKAGIDKNNSSNGGRGTEAGRETAGLGGAVPGLRCAEEAALSVAVIAALSVAVIAALLIAVIAALSVAVIAARPWAAFAAAAAAVTVSPTCHAESDRIPRTEMARTVVAEAEVEEIAVTVTVVARKIPQPSVRGAEWSSRLLVTKVMTTEVRNKVMQTFFVIM